MDLLLEPLRYAFIQRALIASVLIGISCALLGVFVVLRRMANVGHALTHSALPGLALAFIFHANVFAGAFCSTVLTALGIGCLSKDSKVYEDTAVGMVPTVMFAIGVLVISATKSYRDMSAMLFGNILGVTPGDLQLTALICLVIAMGVFLFHKELVLFSVDLDYARTIGIPTAWLRYGLLVLLSLAVVCGIQAVGTILTNALLVGPVAAARLMTRRLALLAWLSCAIAVFACVCGVYLSYYFGLSSGASIVLVCAFIFAVAWVRRNYFLRV